MSAALPVIQAAREACPACPYYAVCPLAPVFLQTEAPRGERKPHPHGRTLEMFLSRGRTSSANFERDLLGAMSGADEGLALIAGCLLAQQHWDEPARLVSLLETINDRAARAAGRSSERRELTPLEEHLQRAAALLQHPDVPRLLSAEARLKRPDREVTVFEAMRLMSRLIAGEPPATWWLNAVHPDDRPAFEASFVMRDKGAGDDSLTAGSLDLFFSARAGSRSLVFYYRRDAATMKQALLAVTSVRADSLLKRLFKVFDTDRKKTHRLFGKICRGLNNGYKDLDKKMLWEGLKQLEREHLVILALYAPRLGKFVEKRAKFAGLYRLVKFLHLNVESEAPSEHRESGGAHRSDGEGRSETGAKKAHEHVFDRREQVGTILETYGKEPFLKLCRALFGIAEAYRPGPDSADIIYKIGEVCYLLTAVEGFNPKGLEVSLAGRNPLAFIAYGLQPAAPKEAGPGRRYRRMVEARARVEQREASNGDADQKRELLRAIDQGLLYMAKIHGFETVDALGRAASQGPMSASSDARPGATGAGKP
jgi:hypothetical protein